MALNSRLLNAWNAFIGRDPTRMSTKYYGSGYYVRPDRVRVTKGSEKSIISSVWTRISNDVAQIPIRHIKTDDEGNYKEDVDSTLNDCLTLEANKDQTARAFIRDFVISMFDEGVVAVVPIDTDRDLDTYNSFEIYTMRVGKIVEWYPDAVKVRVYNDRTGEFGELLFAKSECAIVENPFYLVMNEPNSILQRLIRKLNLLDIIDEQNSSGKLDLIIQLPYTIKTEARKQQAENRRKDIEMQLTGSRYGIAYTDGSEHITQLNRSVDNQLMPQIEYLTNMFYSQLGLTENVFNGTADEKEMKNYYNRTIEPLMSAICDEFKRKFLSKTARSQGHTIRFFQDPFSIVPSSSDLAELADKFTRNEIMSSNEFRQKIGMKPSNDPRANELRNKNLSAAKGEEPIRLDTNKDE